MGVVESSVIRLTMRTGEGCSWRRRGYSGDVFEGLAG